MSKIVAFLKNESGATAIEYGLIAAGISVAIIAVVNTIGTKLNTNFSSISTQLKYSTVAVGWKKPPFQAAFFVSPRLAAS